MDRSNAKVDQLIDLICSTDELKCISFDFFDTLYWRYLGEPRDIYYSLESIELFKTHNITAKERIEAEISARRESLLLHGHSEPRLLEIYQVLCRERGLDSEMAKALTEIEVQTELNWGYIPEHAQKILSRLAREAITVIVISDTYYSSENIRMFMQTNYDNNWVERIKIYASSEYKKSKSQGIWEIVLRDQKIKPNQMLHIGDNEFADFKYPQEFGINAYHFKRYNQEHNKVRQQTIDIFRTVNKITSPVRTNFIDYNIESKDEENGKSILVNEALGPLMYNFAKSIHNHRQGLASNTAVLFLLRDGFLPALVYKKLYGNSGVYEVRINRKSSISASIRNRNDILRVLKQFLNKEMLLGLSKQLLIADEFKQHVLYREACSRDVSLDFANWVLSKSMVKKIVNRSISFSRQIYRHITFTIGKSLPEDLLLVDLGYNASIQKNLARIGAAEWKTNIHGHYLIYKNSSELKNSARGMIEECSLSVPLILAILGDPISAFENLCVDGTAQLEKYSAIGEAVLGSENGVNNFTQISVVQQATVNYCKALSEKLENNDIIMMESPAQLYARLARFIYQPTKEEIKILCDQKYELDLGTSHTTRVIDSVYLLNQIVHRCILPTIQTIAKDVVGIPQTLYDIHPALSTLQFMSSILELPIEARKRIDRMIPLIVLRGGEEVIIDVPMFINPFLRIVVEIPIRHACIQALMLGQRFQHIYDLKISFNDENASSYSDNEFLNLTNCHTNGDNISLESGSGLIINSSLIHLDLKSITLSFRCDDFDVNHWQR
jgi:FMN phosphatase YigB (HAD superfamily)